MVSCFHETVLPAAHVGLFGISPCLEASEKDQDEVEGATTEALPGSLFLLVRASQFCVAPAGQTKLRSGGLREGWLTHVGGCAPCCRPRTRPWRRRFAISLAQVVLAFRCGWSRELLTNSDELEGLLIQAASAQTADPKAVRPGVLLVCASAFGSADCGLCLLVQDEQLQKSEEAPAKTANRCVRQTRRQKHRKAPLHPAGFGPTSTRSGHQAVGNGAAGGYNGTAGGYNGTGSGRTPDNVVASRTSQRQRKGQFAQAGAQRGPAKLRDGPAEVRGGPAEVRGGPAELQGSQRKHPGRTSPGRGFCMCSCCC